MSSLQYQKGILSSILVVISMALIPTARAEVMSMMPLSSARTSPCDNWGCCCGTSSVEMNLSSISIRNCFSQGGYCGNERHMAAWIYKLSDLPQGSNITYMTFAGNRTGSMGSGTISMQWVDSAFLNPTTIYDTLNYPNASLSINWPSSFNYSFVIPSSIYESQQSDYLMVVATTSNDLAMTLTNSGANGARLVMLVEEGCVGDFDGNGQVEVDDLLDLLGVYGSSGSQYDLDGDDYVGVNDLLLILDAFGDCP